MSKPKFIVPICICKVKKGNKIIALAFLTIFESGAKRWTTSESGIEVWERVDAGLLWYNGHVGLSQLIRYISSFVKSPADYRTWQVNNIILLAHFNLYFVRLLLNLGKFTVTYRLDLPPALTVTVRPTNRWVSHSLLVLQGHSISIWLYHLKNFLDYILNVQLSCLHAYLEFHRCSNLDDKIYLKSSFC